MLQRFQENPDLVLAHGTPWLAENIFPVPTEREIATYRKNQAVYRALLRKKQSL